MMEIPDKKPGLFLGSSMVTSSSGEVTRLLLDWRGGDRYALDRLMPLVYAELRRLAAAYLRRERSDHTLQPTALVHEAYLRLVSQKEVDSRCRAQFFAIAANLMRQILVNHAKRRRAGKRGHGRKERLETDAVAVQPQVDLLELEEALTELSRLDPRKCQVVELRFFGGLKEEEIAQVLGVSEITVKRDWRVARAVLHNQLRGSAPR